MLNVKFLRKLTYWCWWILTPSASMLSRCAVEPDSRTGHCWSYSAIKFFTTFSCNFRSNVLKINFQCCWSVNRFITFGGDNALNFFGRIKWHSLVRNGSFDITKERGRSWLIAARLPYAWKAARKFDKRSNNYDINRWYFRQVDKKSGGKETSG